MAREIKFTSFGIPYIHEFENVSFVPEPRQKYSKIHDPRPHTASQPPKADSDSRSPFYSISPSRSSSTSSFCYVESPPILPRSPSFSFLSASSVFKRKLRQHLSHIHPTSSHAISSRTLQSNDPTTEYPVWSANSDDTKPLPSSPPLPAASETHGIYIRSPLEYSHPQMSRKERLVHLQKAISVAVLDAGMSSSPGNNGHPEKRSNDRATHETRGYRTTDALFCGTYGQLMSALEGAGLSATPCVRDPGLSGYTRLGALFVAHSDGGSGVQLRKIALWG